MKSHIWTVTILTAALLITSTAYATYTETGGNGQSGVIEQVTTTVKTTVKKWMDYWGKSEQPAAPAAREEVAKSQPETAPASGAGTGTTTGGEEATPVESAPVAKAKPAPPVASEEQKALRAQPIFEERGEGSSLKDVQAVRDSVRGTNLLGVAKPGRKGTSNLARLKSGVPTIDWKQMRAVKKVPRLDIGTENQISRNDFKVEKLGWGLAKPSDMKRLPKVAPINPADLKKALAIAATAGRAQGAKGMQATMRTVGQLVTHETVNKIQYKIQETGETKILPYKPLTEEHMKMVAALILYEKGNHCHMIMGLFNQLKAAPVTKVEATYHLGACADQLGMHQAAYDHLSKVIASEDRDFAGEALTILAKDLPTIYEQDFYKLLKGVKGHKGMITEASMNDVAYRMAKGAYRSGDYKTSSVYAGQVNEKATFYDDSRFLVAMNSFALGDKKTALTKLEKLWMDIESRKISDSKIRALTSINIARMYFAQKKYDKALEHYMQVPKDHALWVQALIEQGWTQLAINDHSGAIGNMYSLHSPYFKAVYQPESFVVRTIGYINICQYGDAYRTLSYLEKEYRDWYGRTDAYLAAKRTPAQVYNTVKTYIKGKSSENLENVPFQIWREMARRKDFLNLQVALNDKQDETHRYEGVNQKIKTEKAGIRVEADLAKKRFESWRAAVARASTDPSQMKSNEELQRNLKRERDLTVGYRFQLAILEQSRQGYLEFQKTSQGKLDAETAQLTTAAGTTLLKRAQAMRTEMSRVLENNEFLRYEVFAGSGENIRYQVAGGEVSGQVTRVPAHVKPSKMMNWDFDGEFWVDEIGSYRSSLQNACAATQHGSVDTPQPDAQAKLTGN